MIREGFQFFVETNVRNIVFSTVYDMCLARTEFKKRILEESQSYFKIILGTPRLH